MKSACQGSPSGGPRRFPWVLDCVAAAPAVPFVIKDMFRHEALVTDEGANALGLEAVIPAKCRAFFSLRSRPPYL